LYERLGAAKFPTKGLILDTIAQGLGIELSRKDVQRLIKEEKISADKAEELINQMVVQIVESLIEGDSKRHVKIQMAIVKFLHFYDVFTSEFEMYKVSQKQLDYLLLKDIFIPVAADILARIFEDDISILYSIKPDKEKMPIQKMFDWVKQHIPEQKSFLNYLAKKYVNDYTYEDEKEKFKPAYSTDRDNLSGWRNGSVLPKIDSIKRLHDYIKDDITDETTRKLSKPLFLVARLMQETYKTLIKAYGQTHVDMLVEHLYLLMKIHLCPQKFSHPDELREFIYTTDFNHIDPKTLNRDFYWDDYYLFMLNILYSNHSPKELLKEGMKRNAMLYHLSEEEAFKYMKLFLPVNVLVERESLESHAELDLDFKTFMCRFHSKFPAISQTCFHFFNGESGCKIVA
jgi:hypothetical protein